MIPKIKRYNDYYFNGYFKWQVCSKNGIDITPTLGRAIRIWLWHCGVPAKIAFWGICRENSPQSFGNLENNC